MKMSVKCIYSYKQLFSVFLLGIFFLTLTLTEARRSRFPLGKFSDDGKAKASNSSQSQRESERDGRLFNFLGMVNFPQDVCVGDAGESGVCMKKRECTNLGGRDSGSCAQTFGICCSVTKACSPETVVVKQNGSHLTQAGTFQDLCRFEIPRQPGVCQVKLDYMDFNIDEGTSAQIFGTCDTDTLTISGNSNGMLGPLCGSLEGQHMYLDYGTNDKISLDIFMPNSMNQKWDIVVTMIKCDSMEKAPTGCLQYYTGQRGTVQSFNFGNRHQLNDQDYSVCIKTVPGMRKITWKSCGVSDFIISGGMQAFPAPGQPGDPIGNEWSGSMCTTDWVMIFGDNKYCGSQFPATSVSTTQPFMMQVHFDHFELPIPQDLQPADDENDGFCLMYAQSPY